MVAVVISLIALSVVFLATGNILCNLIKKNCYSLFDQFFIGLCLTGTILNIWSLLFPTNHIAFLFLFSASAVYHFIHYKLAFAKAFSILKRKEILFYGFVLLVCILIYSLLFPVMYDSYLYHISAIQWSHDYSAVPGLANLHSRFGFNSSSFVIGAAFSLEFLFDKPIYALNALAMFAIIYWFIINLSKTTLAKSIASLVFLYYFLKQYLLDISSPGTDVLPNILVAYLLFRTLYDEAALKKYPLIYFVIPFFCLTLKISVLPILLLSVISFLKSGDKFIIRRFSFITGLAILIVGPWIIRNVILTGYVIFPVTTFDLFNFDWKVPANDVVDLKNWIYSWAKIPGKHWNEVLPLDFRDWFTVWWNALVTINKTIFVLCVLCPVTLLLIIFKYRNNKIPLHVIYAGTVAFCGFILWFFTAPDIRFSFAFLLFAAILPILLIIPDIKKYKSIILKANQVIALIIIIFFIKKGVTQLYADLPYPGLQPRLLKPIAVKELMEFRKIEFSKKTLQFRNGEKSIFYEPAAPGNQCYDVFPCTPLLHPSIELRGNSIDNGFKIQ